MILRPTHVGPKDTRVGIQFDGEVITRLQLDNNAKGQDTRGVERDIFRALKRSGACMGVYLSNKSFEEEP